MKIQKYIHVWQTNLGFSSLKIQFKHSQDNNNYVHKMFWGIRAWPVHEADNLTAICDPTV
jgi:hypothetical protein